MIKLIKTFLLILIVLFIVFFLTLNNDKVGVNLWFTKFEDASVSMIIFSSLSIGILSGYLVAIFSVLASKADIRSLQMKNRRLSEELNDLRNVAIDEGIYDADDGDY